jgi:hypothetical protein
MIIMHADRIALAQEAVSNPQVPPHAPTSGDSVTGHYQHAPSDLEIAHHDLGALRGGDDERAVQGQGLDPHAAALPDETGTGGRGPLPVKAAR